MLNKFAAIGRLTKDPEVRTTQSGKQCAHFTVACDRDFGQDPTTDFFDCIAWGKTCDFVKNYLSKGRLVAVAGSVQFRDWTDKSGNKRKSCEIRCDDVWALDKRQEPKQEDFLEPINEDDGELPF